MKTFVAEDVLENYGSGMIVVKARNKKKAIEIIKNKLNNYEFIDDCGKSDNCCNQHCLRHRLRELKNNEILYIEGSA